MSELAVAALKILFLIVMWGFVLFAANVIRTDMFGRRVSTSSIELAPPSPAAPVKRTKSRKARKLAADLPRSLTVIEGRQAGVRVPLVGVVGLGRAADSALNLDDDYASTRHAQLTCDETGQWWLEDLASTNGTALNTALITHPKPVRVGDVIRIGRTQLRVDSELAPDGGR